MARFNREDARTALPQLEKEVKELKEQVSKLTKGAYTTNIDDFIEFSSGWSLVGEFYVMRKGNTVQFRMIVESASAISVPASGDISNIQIGTLKQSWRPPFMATWCAHHGTFATGYITAAGVLTMAFCEGTGTARTIAAGSPFYAAGVYIVSRI